MLHNLVEFLSPMLSPESMVIVLSAAPVSELRGAIPLALGHFNFSIQKAVFLSVFGNMRPVIPLLLGLNKFSEIALKIPVLNRLLNWWFARTRKHSDVVEKYEALGLILFVAIPLPVTGAWSGCVAAYLLGIKFKYALPCIFAGVLIAAAIVTLASVGILKSIALF